MNFVKEANETLSYIYAASIFVLSTSILCCLLNEDFRFIKPKPLYVLEMLFKLKNYSNPENRIRGAGL